MRKLDPARRRTCVSAEATESRRDWLSGSRKSLSAAISSARYSRSRVAASPAKPMSRLLRRPVQAEARPLVVCAEHEAAEAADRVGVAGARHRRRAGAPAPGPRRGRRRGRTGTGSSPASATAELTPAAGEAFPATATGGGYDGPLAYRQGKPTPHLSPRYRAVVAMVQIQSPPIDRAVTAPLRCPPSGVAHGLSTTAERTSGVRASPEQPGHAEPRDERKQPQQAQKQRLAAR